MSSCAPAGYDDFRWEPLYRWSRDENSKVPNMSHRVNLYVWLKAIDVSSHLLSWLCLSLFSPFSFACISIYILYTAIYLPVLLSLSLFLYPSHIFHMKTKGIFIWNLYQLNKRYTLSLFLRSCDDKKKTVKFFNVTSACSFTFYPMRNDSNCMVSYHW